MTAKEFLIDNNFSEKIAYIDCINKNEFSYPLIFLMENYTNFRLRLLESELMSFRNNYLKHFSEIENSDAEFAEYLLHQYDMHFNLKDKT
jgi:hypothetical protein